MKPNEVSLAVTLILSLCLVSPIDFPLVILAAIIVVAGFFVRLGIWGEFPIEQSKEQSEALKTHAQGLFFGVRWKTDSSFSLEKPSESSDGFWSNKRKSQAIQGIYVALLLLGLVFKKIPFSQNLLILSFYFCALVSSQNFRNYKSLFFYSVLFSLLRMILNTEIPFLNSLVWLTSVFFCFFNFQSLLKIKKNGSLFFKWSIAAVVLTLILFQICQRVFNQQEKSLEQVNQQVSQEKTQQLIHQLAKLEKNIKSRGQKKPKFGSGSEEFQNGAERESQENSTANSQTNTGPIGESNPSENLGSGSDSGPSSAPAQPKINSNLQKDINKNNESTAQSQMSASPKNEESIEDIESKWRDRWAFLKENITQACVFVLALLLLYLVLRKSKNNIRSAHVTPYFLDDETRRKLRSYFRKLYSQSLPPAIEVTRAYEGLEQVFEYLNRKRETDIPPLNHSLDLEKIIPVLGEPFVPVTRYFSLVRYGDHKPVESEMKIFRKNVHIILHKLNLT